MRSRPNFATWKWEGGRAETAAKQHLDIRNATAQKDFLRGGF
jgi:hypothetical protein